VEIARRDLMQFGAGALLAALAGPGLAVAGPGPNLDFVDPELRDAARLLLRTESGRAWTDATLAGIRAHAPPPAVWRPDVPVEERKIPRGGTQSPLTLYVINARPDARRPGILHTHGGGFILGSARGEVPYLQQIARDLDCVIVSVEYRLAPETTFAGSTDDNYRGLRWAYGNADLLGIDRSKLVVMGESAGGGHAALLALLARERGEVPLAAQVLVYPMLDDRTGSTRMPPRFMGAVGWNADGNRFGWRSFLGQQPGTRTVPAAAVPARHTDLAGLPPTFIGVGGIDLFVGEDVDYARRLIEVGVPTDLLVVPGAFHGFDRVATGTAVARRFNKAKYNFLRRVFGEAVEV
jgi:acetyl esterase/lipase